MISKALISALNGLWLMEESQAAYWADIAFKMLIDRSMTAIPGRDPRFDRRGNQNYHEIFRVEQNGTQSSTGPVQVLQIIGPMMEDDYCGSPGMHTLENAVRSASADSSIESIVLWVDSPGGSVSGTENLAKAVKSSSKPVVSFINNMMASAAYWVGSSASEIIADTANGGYNTLIGSIGTKAAWIDRSKEMENKGWKVVSVYADGSPRKGAFSDEIDKGDYTRLKGMLNKLNDGFHAAVKENRGSKLVPSKENVFEGDMYNVKQALHLGLIDKMADFNYAVKRSLQLAKTLKAA